MRHHDYRIRDSAPIVFNPSRRTLRRGMRCMFVPYVDSVGLSYDQLLPGDNLLDDLTFCRHYLTIP